MSASGGAAGAVPRSTRRGEQGFTLIEVLIALLILLVGVAGVLTIQLVTMRSTGLSRHATEASFVGEKKMEELRTVPAISLTSGTDTVDAQGNADPQGLFSRTWTIGSSGSLTSITVEVEWYERGVEPYTVVLATQRRPTL